MTEKLDLGVRVFRMIRHSDESGVSGTGCILEGVQFHNGQVAVCWRSDVEGNADQDPSIGVYPNWKSFEKIHILSHPTNGTEVVWEDGGDISKDTA